MCFFLGNADFQNIISVLEHKMYLTFLMHMCGKQSETLIKCIFNC